MYSICIVYKIYLTYVLKRGVYMFISNLKIKNFKSISSADINFEPLTMLVGANASGKSNLINVLDF